jgi:hypothetical protein
MSKKNSSPCYVIEANKIDFDFDFDFDFKFATLFRPVLLEARQQSHVVK